MIEYKIVKAEGYQRLERGVNNLIEKGWEPVGGASAPAKVRKVTSKRVVAQAMIRKPENKPETTDTEPAENVGEEASEGDSKPEDEPETEDSSEYVNATEPKK